MVKFRALDQNNDWTFGYGLANYQTDDAAIALDVKTALLEWVGDCFFALLDGIDWKTRLDFNQKTALDNDITNLIKTRYGVMGITSFSSQLIGRQYSASYTIQTIYSTSFTDSINSSQSGGL